MQLHYITKIGGLMMGVANLDIETKEKLEVHDRKLEDHDKRINKIEIGFGKTEEQVAYIIKGQDELKEMFRESEKTNLQSTNTMLSLISQLVLTKENNKNKVYIQLIITVGALLGGIFAGTRWF